MRILHVFPSRKNDRTENYAAGVIFGLQAARIEQSVVIDRRSPYAAAFEKAGIRIIPRASVMPGFPLRRLRLHRLIARWRPDIAHCWTRSATRLVPAGPTPVVGWLAGYDEPGRFPRCTHLISADRFAIRHLSKKGGADVPAKFIPIFCESAAAPPLERHVLATSHEAKVLVSLAPLHPDSRLDLLLDVLKDLPDGVVWLAGSGPLRYMLENQARDMGVLDRVRLVPSHMNRNALLRAADVCVLTAAERPYGAIIPKAWAAGTPVIASQKKESAAPLEEGITGLLAPIGDEAALRRTLRRILEDDNLRRRLVAKGYAAYLNRYAREAVIRQWMDFYREVAAAND